MGDGAALLPILDKGREGGSRRRGSRLSSPGPRQARLTSPRCRGASGRGADPGQIVQPGGEGAAPDPRRSGATPTWRRTTRCATPPSRRSSPVEAALAWARPGRIFTGVSLGSILLAGGLGLAITYGRDGRHQHGPRRAADDQRLFGLRRRPCSAPRFPGFVVTAWWPRCPWPSPRPAVGMAWSAR